MSITVKYKCANCGRIIDAKDLDILPGIRCSYCGSKVLYKIRPPKIKRVKAI
ncbi:MAG: DNA-directed RNA polymerase subunit P [Thermoprotei archaeon]|nr:MAG: DNA-directed RNA polymerase subunit P [Thermoprotei archaeon]HDJ94793.1 DNA-directed RNA polymerase subunit P [Acidilobales archaeon]